MPSYIILGAGAIGSALGGALAQAGCRTALVARKPHVEAILKQGGLLQRTLKGTMLQPIVATSLLTPSLVSPDSVIFLTTKANDTAAAIGDLRGIDSNTPVVCWQNGVDNEAEAGRRFSRVYGGVVRLTATMKTPGETMYAGTGTLILGVYPSGADDLARWIAGDLTRAGFTARVSSRIMDDKWLKLLVSLISCVKPIVRAEDVDKPARKDLCRLILQEGIAVLQKAGITATSTNGTEDSPEEMLRHFDRTLALADGEGQGMALQNSTWQSLARQKKQLEHDWYTGTIVGLGARHGIPTPCNATVIFFLRHIAENGLGPNSISLASVIAKARDFGASLP